MDPPTYSLSSSGPDADELPNYADLFNAADRSTIPSAPRQRTTHVYGVRSRTDASEWLKLRVVSRAKHASQLPICCQGDSVVGTIELDLERQMTVRSVRISLTGDLITADATQTMFLKISQELWSSSHGDPCAATASGNTTACELDGRPTSTWDGKLKGLLSWPFSLELPNVVILKSEKSWNTYKLPASFLERGARVTVVYRLLATVTRSVLHGTSSVDTIMNYIPRIQPDPPSIARQIAYQERHPLLEPSADPEGWHTLEPVLVLGTMFGTRDVGIKCTLSLAKPLTYTRGSLIPLCLGLETGDMQALDLLSTLEAPVVCVRRDLMIKTRKIVAPGDSVLDPRKTTEIATAVWWPSPFQSTLPPSTKRVLQGEISLPRTLAPTASLDLYEIIYKLVLLPFAPVGFIPVQATGAPLREVLVEIGTTFPPGPYPISYAPLPLAQL